VFVPEPGDRIDGLDVLDVHYVFKDGEAKPTRAEVRCVSCSVQFGTQLGALLRRDRSCLNCFPPRSVRRAGRAA
jgi:hypothetical protein